VDIFLQEVFSSEMLLMMLFWVVLFFSFNTQGHWFCICYFLCTPWFFSPSGSPPKRASLRNGYWLFDFCQRCSKLFFEDFKAFGFFFSLLDPENIYLLALGILTCSFYNAWCEKKSVGMIQSKEFRGLKEVEALEKRNMLIVCTFWDTCLPKKMIVVVFQNLGKEHIDFTCCTHIF